MLVELQQCLDEGDRLFNNIDKRVFTREDEQLYGR